MTAVTRPIGAQNHRISVHCRKLLHVSPVVQLRPGSGSQFLVVSHSRSHLTDSVPCIVLLHVSNFTGNV
jgi:hypothetical protein